MTDTEVRLAAFEWLEAQVSLYGDVLPRTLLAHGFQFQNRNVALLGPRGIWKPQVLPRYPLSISTTPKGPYRDFFGSDGHLSYAYQGNDPENTDNVGLRAALTHQVPLVYFHGVVPGRYLAAWPVYVVGDDLRGLRFTVAVEDLHHFALQYRETGRTAVDDEGSSGRRRYVTAQYRVRLHQTAFRERVLVAYQDQCSLCRLRHRELLDAAHIIPDAEPEGDPVVPNGLALCKLHHAAFDRYFLTVTPEYRIEVRPDILEEHDGPILVHGLKALHGQEMQMPRAKVWLPDRERLATSYGEFRRLPHRPWADGSRLSLDQPDYQGLVCLLLW